MDVLFDLIGAIADAVREAVLISFTVVVLAGILAAVTAYVVIRRKERKGTP